MRSDLPAAEPTVLVAEDESTLRELIRVCLGPGYRFLEAADGEEALEVARCEVPDLIVLDLMLPRRTGLEVLAEIRRDAASVCQIGVLVLTAQPALLGEALADGADEAMSKPFEPDALAGAAEAVLDRRRAACRAA